MDNFTWQIFGKPKNFNIVELGPGDGSLTKVLLKYLKDFLTLMQQKKFICMKISSFLKNYKKKILKIMK